MELSEIFRRAENKTLEIGSRFNADSFTCTESALGKVKFSWSGNTNYEIEMLTDLHIPRVRGLMFGESGILIYNETVHDNVTGKDVSVKYKVQFNAVFEWRRGNAKGDSHLFEQLSP